MQSPDLAWLVVAAVLNSLVSVYYYLRIVVAMYFRDPVQPWQPFRSAGMAVVLVAIVVVVLALGLVPGPAIDLAAGGLGALR
jgi:NADH-quinone oxidoreductase subunit N